MGKSRFFVGVKIVEAFPQEKYGKPGYGVIYQNGYQSWSPKDVFESAYFPMGAANDEVDQEMLDSFMVKIATHQIDTRKICIDWCTLTGLRCYSVGRSDSKEFDAEDAEKNAKREIIEYVRKFFEFVVRWGRFGLTGNIK